MLKLADAIIVEEIITDAVAEVIVGVSRDPQFGPVLVIGSGGILVELIGDSRTLTLPATRSEIEASVRSLRVFKLIDGFRGRPRGDLGGTVNAIEAIVRFVEANADKIQELDINPLMVRPQGEGVVAADALIRMGT
jgi:acyl-CoA synthetase (NDP forming)